MAAPASPSSDDPETLKALLAEERAENERLRQIILAMQRHRFGRRAESLPEDQLLLGLEEAEQVEAAGFAAEESEPAKKEARRAKRRTNRGALPAHLPRVECLVDVDSTACPCCSGALHRIGEDVSGTAADRLRGSILCLRNDADIAPELCRAVCRAQQPRQLDQRRDIDARRPGRHAGAVNRIEHPSGHGDHNAGRRLHQKHRAVRPLLDPAHQHLPAEMGVPAVMNLRFLPDMGRMNG